MHILKLILLLSVVTSCGNPSGRRVPEERDLKMSSESHSFLKEGIYKVEYYASKEVTNDQKRLLRKISKLIETNNRTHKFFRQIEDGEKPSFNSNIGISKKEYNQLIELFSYKAPEKSKGTLTVSKVENRLYLKGDGRLSLLDSVEVNINSFSSSFKQYIMSRQEDSIDLSYEDIPKGETLESFEFYSGPDGILGLTGLNGVYELLIGKLKPTGRTYLSFFARQPDKLEHPMPDHITVILEKLIVEGDFPVMKF